MDAVEWARKECGCRHCVPGGNNGAGGICFAPTLRRGILRGLEMARYELGWADGEVVEAINALIAKHKEGNRG